jgi:hypothetical protein
MRIRTMAAFAAGIVVAASGTALATTKMSSIVGPDNQIHGCYLTSAGLLRVVAAGTACRDGESPIAWTATGAGAQGPAGPAGPPGVRWRGAWVSGTSYSPGDLVRRDGSVWIVRSGIGCAILNPNCSNTVGPPSNPIWTRFAQDGAVGATGPQGPPGPEGSSSTRLLQTVTVFGARSTKMIFAGPRSASSSAHCPSGYVVTGGGFQLTSDVPGSPYPEVDSSYGAGPTTWRAEATAADYASSGYIRAWATCARLS